MSDVVLLKHDNMSPCVWSLALFIDILFGSESNIREVTVKTSESVVKGMLTQCDSFLLRRKVIVNIAKLADSTRIRFRNYSNVQFVYRFQYKS